MPRVKKETPPPEHSASVREYESTLWWRKKSDALLEDKECKCAICGRKRWKWLPRGKRWKRVHKFSVHHTNYRNLPHEKEEDLMVLCVLCHNLFHDFHRYKGVGKPYAELYEWSKKYFMYEGMQTFVPW